MGAIEVEDAYEEEEAEVESPEERYVVWLEGEGLDWGMGFRP